MTGTTALLLAAGLVLTAAGGGQAAPREQTRTQAPPDHLPGDRHDTKAKDNRKGRVAASDRQRDRAAALGARVRWTDFGTPATLTSTGKPLATGLPADPATGQTANAAPGGYALGLDTVGSA
ncbi:peptidase M36, partial [Micromonospora aurantiaca]